MILTINYLAVLVAAVVGMVLGGLWYGPLFGKQWIAMMGWTPEQIETAKAKGMSKSYAIMFVGSLLMAYVLAHSYIFASTYLQNTGVFAGIMAGFWSWLGFIAPVMVGTVIWEGRSWKLWSLNAGYYLVDLMIMGMILAAW